MSLNTDPLAGLYEDEEEVSNDPLAGLYEDEEESSPYENVVDKELQAKGYEPDITEEFERMYELGDREAAKGLLAGGTLGLSKLVPGLKPGENIAAKGGEFIGSFAPISGLSNVIAKPLLNLASKSPILQSQLSSLANMMGMGATGAVVGGLEEATESGSFKMPSMEDVIAHGAIWGAIDAAVRGAGFAGRFAKGLYNAVKGSGSSEAKVMNELASRMGTEALGESPEKISEKAMDILSEIGFEKSGKGLSLPEKIPSKAERISEETFGKIEQTASDLRNRKAVKLDFNKPSQSVPEPYLPGEFNSEQIADEVINKEVEEAIDAYAPAAENEMAFGKEVSKDIEAVAKKSEEATDKLYEKALSKANKKDINVEKSANRALEKFKSLEEYDFKTNPEGYTKAKAQLRNFIEDLGYSIIEDASGKAEHLIKDSETSLGKAIGLKQRANKLAKYDLKDTGAHDFIKDPLSALREDIRAGYGPKDSEARKAFEAAEKGYGENAERLKRQAAKKARYTEKPESVARLVRTPSGLQDVKQVVSPEQFKKIERSILDHMQKLDEGRARTLYKELRPQLSRDAQGIAEQIIESKIPAKAPGKKELQRQKIQNAFLDDISQSSITGEKPDKALKLWKTKEGQQLIKEALKDNPNKEEVLKYLTDQSFKDFSESIMNKEGIIDFQKLKSFMNDPSTIENIRMIGGEDAVNFFKQAEQLSQRVERNASLIEGRIDKGTSRGRKEVEDALRAKYKARISKEKPKGKAESISEEAIGPKGAKGRKEIEQLAKERGEQKLGKIAEERNKNDLFRRFEDWTKTLSEGNKVLMTIFGIKFLGASTLGGGIIAAKVLERVVKSPALRAAYRRAASSKAQSPLYFMNAMEKVSEEAED